MKRAREFYEGVLGLQPDPEMTGEMWIEYSIGAGTLAVACIGDQWKPSDQGTSAALEVESLEDAIARLEERKVPFRQSSIRRSAGWRRSRTRTGTNWSSTN